MGAHIVNDTDEKGGRRTTIYCSRDPRPMVCHYCVNPNHLFLGSHADNTRDMMSKGRGRYAAHVGEKNGAAVLNESQVRLIKAELREGQSLAVIGQRYGVTKQAIWLIKHGKKWGHVL